MGVRYLIATLAAYLVFIFSLWVWTKSTRRDNRERFDGVDLAPDLVPFPTGLSSHSSAESQPFQAGGGRFGGGGATEYFGPTSPMPIESGFDVPLDIDEPVSLAVIVAAAVAVGAALTAVGISFYFVYTAPALFAELLLDGAVSAALFRKLNKLDRRDWVTTALRKTWVPAFLLIVFFAAAGWAIQVFMPNVNSLGDIFRE